MNHFKITSKIIFDVNCVMNKNVKMNVIRIKCVKLIIVK